MYLLTSERGLQHLILHLWCYPFSFNIFRPVREQWLQACSARESEPGVEGGGPRTRALSHGTKTRGTEQVWGVTRAANGSDC